MENKNSGNSLLSVLTIVFIILKLCGVINWSWFWVLSPILIPTGIFLIFLIISAIYVLITGKE